MLVRSNTSWIFSLGTNDKGVPAAPERRAFFSLWRPQVKQAGSFLLAASVAWFTTPPVAVDRVFSSEKRAARAPYRYCPVPSKTFMRRADRKSLVRTHHGREDRDE